MRRKEERGWRRQREINKRKTRNGKKHNKSRERNGEENNNDIRRTSLFEYSVVYPADEVGQFRREVSSFRQRPISFSQSLCSEKGEEKQ